jgi:hypothetical protein
MIHQEDYMWSLKPKLYLNSILRPAVLLIYALFVITLPALSQEKDKDKPIGTITRAELRDHIFFLGSDHLEGRLPGSEGYQQAAYYIASQLQAAGLAPVIKNQEGKESYFQLIDFEISTITPKSTLRIKKGQEETAFAFGEHFVPLLHIQAFKEGHYEGNPVFIGYGIEESQDGWNDYENIDVSGKIVVIMSGAPMKDGKPVLPEEKHKLYSNVMQGASKRLISAFNHKAAGVLMIADPDTAKMWPKLVPQMNRPTRRLKADEQKEQSRSLPIFFLNIEAASVLLKETGFDPVSAQGEVKPTPLEGVMLSFDLQYKIEREFVCRNVVGFIPGSDLELKNEYVVVGAHLDHLGMRNDDAMNGADDNASGCAAILEAAEAAVMSPQRRSLFYVFFTAEEGAGQGSYHFVDNFPFFLKDIKLAINVDMVGRNSEPFPDFVLGIPPDNLKLELSEFINKANNDIAHVSLKTYLDEDDLGGYYGGSDEMMFFLRGIPAVLITNGFSHPDYHMPSDEPAKINYKRVSEAARLIYALATTAANAEKLYFSPF